MCNQQISRYWLLVTRPNFMSIGLGRGLSSLIPEKILPPEKTKDPDFTWEAGDNEVLITEIKPNPNQPRKDLDPEKLLELSRSIKRHGILQPLVVNENYELIAGQRRLEAARMAGLRKVPVIVHKIDEEQSLEMSIVENVQRHDLNPIEEASGYKLLAQKFSLSQEEIAKRVGKKRSTIGNSVRLLSLPLEIQKGLCEGKINSAHAKVILSLENPEKQISLYHKIIQEGLTRDRAQSLIDKVIVRKHARKTLSKNPFFAEAEEKLQEVLGCRIKISRDGRVGKILIEFYEDEELEGILGKIG